jgi:hypothetical protein
VKTKAAAIIESVIVGFELIGVVALLVLIQVSQFSLWVHGDNKGREQ